MYSQHRQADNKAVFDKTNSTLTSAGPPTGQTALESDDDPDEFVGPSPQEWGDQITLDHAFPTLDPDEFKLGKLYGIDCAVIMKDRSHGEIGVQAESTKNTVDTVHAINMFAGQRKIKAAYSDGSEEIQAACKQLCIPHTTSTPGRPRSNGVAERTVRQVITGVRVALHAAGLPDPFWQYAASHWCHSHNITSGEGSGQHSAYYHKW